MDETKEIDQNHRKDFTKCQIELQAKLKNKSVNKFTNSKYCSLTDLLKVTVPVLQKYGFMFLQSNRNSVNITEPHSILCTEIRVIKTGELVTCSELVIYFNQVTKDYPNPLHKMAGSFTYFKRYELYAILGVCPEDEDVDGNIYNEYSKSSYKPKPTYSKPTYNPKPTYSKQ